MSAAPEPTVFVVEDDAAVRESLLLLLKLKGYAALGFDLAESFLAVVRAGQSGCLLLDLRILLETARVVLTTEGAR